jgi:N utilization substance protein A
MITSELARLVDAIQAEKNLSRDVVIDIIQSAVEAAARKALGQGRDIEAQYDDDAGEVDIYEYKTVVDEVTNDEVEISLEDAREHDSECMIGDSLGFKVNIGTDELGRIAAQTAKQVVIQKIRDAERDMTFQEFKDKKGELITGIVRRFEKQSIIVDLNRTEAILPRREQVATETYRPGDRIQAYVIDINKAARQPQVILSRTHPGLLMKLFEKEVPEIYEGIVVIEACAREPGHRAKIAVSSFDPQIDPIGTCVGLRGSRVTAVSNECRGEMIDVIEFSADPVQFAKNAIAPAHVTMVFIDEASHSMDIIVPDPDLARAIGRRGQNVRLAQDLTGWKLDVHSESWHWARVQESREELSRLQGIDTDTLEALLDNDFRSAKELADAEPSEVAAILRIDEQAATALVDAADALVEAMIMEEAAARKAARDGQA